MSDKYTIYADGKKWKVVEIANPHKVVARGLTGAEARAKCAQLNGRG